MKVFVLLAVHGKAKIEDVMEDISCVISYNKMIKVGLAYDILLELEGSEDEIREKSKSIRHIYSVNTVLQLIVVA